MELDFSKLEALAYRGIDGEENRAKKDELIERGYAFVEAAQMPFEGPPALEADTSPATDKSPSERKLKPFTGMDTSRNYRALYRAACDYHEAHNPPTVNREYWKTHIPGEDETPQEEIDYWVEAAKGLRELDQRYNNDPFLTGLLVAIYDELSKEYRARREAASEGRRS